VTASAVDLRKPEVFEALYDTTLAGIYGYFLRRCGGRVTTAEDLTSETYLRAIKQIRQGGVVDEPVRWLYGIARYTLIDHYRSSLREADRVIPWNERAEQAPDEHDAFTQVLERDLAIAALGRLAAAQRVVIVLRYLDGLRVAEIAEVTGKSEHAVESLLSRGRTAFKRFYRESEDA
jgi:RNA polymerase sigma-70 factor (ECF subfamily)